MINATNDNKLQNANPVPNPTLNATKNIPMTGETAKVIETLNQPVAPSEDKIDVMAGITSKNPSTILNTNSNNSKMPEVPLDTVSKATAAPMIGTPAMSSSATPVMTPAKPPAMEKPPGFDDRNPDLKPKNKFSAKMIGGLLVLVLIVVGAIAGFFLTQQTQDLRQQAYLGQSCNQDSNCSGWPNEKCDNGECVATNTGTNCPAFVAWESCDPTPSTPDINECTGSHYTHNACVLGYIEWRCGNKNWLPDYGNPANNQCVGDCSWELTNGICCPRGVDACNPSVDDRMCIPDPYVSECKPWNNTDCPANQQGYWEAQEWCVGAGCECAPPNGIFLDETGPGCNCTTSTVYQCNSDCTTSAQCQGSLGANYSCVTSKCRLTSNPTSNTCQPATVYACDSTCTTNAQCAAVNSAWSCDATTSKCRLTSNPTSTTCTAAPLVCNSTCTTNAQCAAVNSAWSCDATTSKCRLTSNPTSTTCEPAVIPGEPMCKDVAILNSNNEELNPATDTFSIGMVLKFRCAADDPDIQITKYEFKVTQPDGTIVQGSAINPAGSSSTSQEYQITQYLDHQVQCRVCTSASCQDWVSIIN